MMCQPCKDAGTYSFEARDKTLRRKRREWLRGEAAMLHELCTNPNTCTCQHRASE